MNDVQSGSASSKLVSQLVIDDPEMIDIVTEFGAEPDVAEVDAVVRERMQDALDCLARERRFPILG